jgi:putative endonuclease
MAESLSILKQDIRPSLTATSQLGIRGEEIAALHLESNGYRLVLKNFRVPIGRNTKGVSVTGEIDIVALDGEVLCFVEVKTKRSAEFSEPIATVTLRKQRQIIRTARVYCRVFGLKALTRRYDVVSIVLAKDSDPKIEVTKGLWTEGKFRKRAWTGDIY